MFEKYFLVVSAIAGLGIILISFLMFPNSVSTMRIFAKFTLREFTVLLIFQQILSLMLYFLIAMLPIIKSLKGKNESRQLFYMGYLMKIVISLIIITILPNEISNIIDFYKVTVRYPHVLELTENMYSFGVGRKSTYLDEVGSEKTIMLQKELVDNNGLMKMLRGYIPDKDNQENLIPVVFVDKSYASKYKILNDSELTEKNVIAVFGNFNDSRYLKSIQETIEYYGEQKPLLIRYDTCAPTFSVQDLLYVDCITDKAIIYRFIEETGEVNGQIFHFNGNVTEAQVYIDEIFKKYGYTSAFEVSSLKSSYQSTYDWVKNRSLESLGITGLLLMVYLLTNKLLIEYDISANEKRYEISRYEGVNPYSGFIYILKIVSATLISLVISLVLGKTAIEGSSYWLLLIAICELLTYWYFYNLSKGKGD